ncbi:MAG: HD domain-containing protein [Desulfobacter sp.]|nr:MAG: HD domain-containing protein [Desulfobacter sp.]
MSDFLSVRESQIKFFNSLPFYYKSKDGEFVLYKKAGEILSPDRADQGRHPQLYIQKKHKSEAIKELTQGLNMEFEKQLASGGLVGIKNALGNIVKEALAPGQGEMMTRLPETIDILFKNMDRDHTTMSYLAKVAGSSELMVEHTVNVTALTLQYCFFLKMSEGEARNLALCALLHDVGVSTLETEIIECEDRLSATEFKRYKLHPEAGHDMIIMNTDFDIAVANTALEHHERLDKTGYPNGTDLICRESQIIGFIDSYEALTYRNKSFRKAKKPFDTLKLIKKEVMEGKFSLDVFKTFTSCLIR